MENTRKKQALRGVQKWIMDNIEEKTKVCLGIKKRGL